MVIRAIFYDLDGTLRMNVPSGWQSFTEYAGQFGLHFLPENRLRAARWEHYYFAESPELHEDEAAFPEQPSFWANYGRRRLIMLGASPEQAAEFAPLVTRLMFESYKPVDTIPTDLIDTLKTLKEQGYILGVLSNRKASYSDYLAERGLSEYFSLAVFAGEAGIYKPDPGVFHYLLEKAGVSAEESMYIGDNYYADVVGAREAGMAPVLLDINGLFEEPGCPVIKSHSQILSLLDIKQ